MSRLKLPNRRDGETLRFHHDGVRYFATISRDASGTLAEVFLSAGKVGSPVNIMAHDLAVTVSIALQHGVEIAEIQSALSQELDGTPRGPLGTLLTILAKED